MKTSIEIDSEIYFFEEEETNGKVVFEKERVRYIYFFPIEHANVLVQEDLNLKDKGYSDLQIAERLLEYRLNDA